MLKTKKDIREIIKEKTLVLDGAMGTMLQKYNLKEEDFRKGLFKNHKQPLIGNYDLLSLTYPEIVKEIHRKYFEAGADICKTNTFSGTSVVQADYNLESVVYDINFQSAKIARKITDEFTENDFNKPRYVAGVVGPTNRTVSISSNIHKPILSEITFDELVKAYSLQVKALIEGGVDLLLVETVFDTLNTKAALNAINTIQEELKTNLPVMVSATITNTLGKTLTGETIDSFLDSIAKLPVFSVGLNCVLGDNQLRQYLKTMSEKALFYVSVHPNAGLPNSFGKYEQTPSMMSSQVDTILKEGLVNIIGGCCGTTPKHIKMIADSVNKYEVRKTAKI